MNPAPSKIREELLSRRGLLAEVASLHRETRLVELLRDVDEALDRLATPEWGLCGVCRGPIDPARLEVDPLVRVCIECLSPEERRDLERDLASAARVQQTLLPPPSLAVDGWEVGWVWEPRGAVSGDVVDLLPPSGDGEPLHILLGDVVGKGVAASLLQSHLHALFRALASPELAPPELLERANRLFAEATDAASYVTVVAARLEADGALEMTNAGHPRPLLSDHRGVRPVEGAGLPLGLFSDVEYGSRRLRLERGETILLYTDGWIEAAVGEEEYGVGRAAAAFARTAEQPLPELLAACRDDLDAFLGGTSRSDDLTLLAVRRS